MKKYVFESLKFFCAAILCTILSAFTTPSWGANCNLLNPDTITSTTVTIPVEYGKTYVWSYDKTNYDFRWDSRAVYGVDSNNEPVDGGVALSPGGNAYTTTSYFVIQIINPSVVAVQTIFRAASIQPTIESIKNSKMMFEEGTTATAYTPYNPQCATCDGTIVNYTSATGTGVQNGTPTPTNPIDPVFYQQGNMVLRKVGDYADSYDATTGKITRRVGVAVLDGTETWSYNEAYSRFVTSLSDLLDANARTLPFVCTHCQATRASETNPGYIYNATNQRIMITDSHTTVRDWKQWLAQQYAAGTPVTVWYPLETETTEDWPASQCTTEPITIATTKYNETKFSPLNAALQNAISVVDTVVSNTITQAGRIATLQAQKQTRPNDIADDNEKCPAGKKCLLVTDTSGVPHWYEIVERYSRLPDGYTQLQWIESTGTQYIDTGVVFDTLNTSVEIGYDVITVNKNLFGFNKIDTDKNWYTAYSSNGSVYIASSSKLTSFGEGTSGVKRDVIFTTTDQNKLTVKVNGSEVYNNSFNGTFITENQPSFAIFTTNGNLVDSRITSSRVWYTKLYKDNILVFNGIPAKNSDGKIGMYDTVEGRFYENAGTGSFIAGDPVSE